MAALEQGLFAAAGLGWAGHHTATETGVKEEGEF